jgi:hypothetical protein
LVAESELVAAPLYNIYEWSSCLQVANSIGLKGKKPMILEVDNKGTTDLTNSWSVGWSNLTH